ncbi:polysaccharide pyruvyl transferase family protein [Paenibacillus sp. N3.4]|uniref:polysaccharide pyruvyl transferase family protein n=1 Tax=Paenibacillus sp. N3.4 TaxID=2603222 RepID=UPI0011CABB24|nr:polysaccharide pyruvyl transferase family protein [Paenibacillus sp. N3.4]TXK82504.1 polysaccharide pyruvyl transferase family protein [Paenibacillus sp. N3.4]
MKVCTITCHDVYNHGASLQAYGLMRYLKTCGHDVEIIDYKPDYLSNHYNLWSVNNPKWEKNKATKFLYVALKIPTRLRERAKKRAFDKFKSKYLPITNVRYTTNEQLKKDTPHADAYLCGSDQIWNCLHKNGKDPAFYLDFVPDEKIKAAYAASFATDSISDEYQPLVKERVERLDAIGVREKSGVEILSRLNINKANHVVDPVFLLDKRDWDQLGNKEFPDQYILIYDFDSSSLIKKIAMEVAKEKGYKIYTLHSGKLKYADKYFTMDGPETFVSLVKNAQFIISNSFHAAVFSILYEKPFVIVNRTEAINTRMRDLLDDLQLKDRLVSENYSLQEIVRSIEFQGSKKLLQEKIDFSKRYLHDVLSIQK